MSRVLSGPAAGVQPALASRSRPGGLGEFFRYHGVWAPGVRLFRVLGFRAKAAVISLVFAMPIGLLASAYYSDKAAAIAFSAAERVGVRYVADVLPVLRAAHHERTQALKAAAEGQAGQDPPALREARDAVAARLKTLAATEAAIGSSLGTAGAHKALVEATAALPSPSAGIDRVLEAHNRRVAAVLDLITQAADGSNLTLDPDLDSYYLMEAVTSSLPSLSDAVAQLQAAGLAIGASATPPDALRRVGTVHHALGDHQLARWSGSIAKVETVHGGWGKGLDHAALVADIQRLHAQSAQSAFDTAFAQRADSVLDRLDAAAMRSMTRLDELLQARIDGLAGKRVLVSVWLALSGLLVAYLFVAFRKVLEGGINEVAHHINAMREGDLTTSPRAWGADEVARLMNTLADMQASLRGIVQEVRHGSEQIVAASTQIAGGAQDLSARTEASAANLEETASAMEQIAATVRRGEEVVQEANTLAGANAKAATRGGEVVGELVQTMQSINASSVRIGDIIGTIDGIAFQTNILALNAAVEAARAGEQGRGFAVVAGEVRALAQRSAQAAREVKALVGNSLAQTESGVRVVREAGGAIQEIVGSATRVNQLLAEVMVGAREQTAGVMQSAHSVQTLDGATQQNAALVEQTAAAADSLREQAMRLADQVSRFRLPAGALA